MYRETKVNKRSTMRKVKTGFLFQTISDVSSYIYIDFYFIIFLALYALISTIKLQIENQALFSIPKTCRILIMYSSMLSVYIVSFIITMTVLTHPYKAE